MEFWLPLALLSPLLFAGTNFIDKYLIEKITEDSKAIVITILAGLAGLPFLIIAAIVGGGSLIDFGYINAIGAITAGLLVISGYYFYYRALLLADASLVAALFQLIVAFNYLLGRFFLQESLNVIQVIAIAMVVIGSIVLTLESQQKKIKFKKGVFSQMLAACGLIAASDVVFKLIAKESSFLPTQFFEYSAGVIVGCLLLVFNKTARSAFTTMIQKHKRLAIRASAIAEIVSLGGLVSMRYAMYLAPIAVVQSVMSVQALYLLLLGVLLTKLFPHHIKENIARGHLLQKFLAVLIMAAGTTVLAIGS